VPITENIIHSCDAEYDEYQLCSESINAPTDCKETKLNLANTNTEGLQNAYQAEFRILYINNT
jgi:hypothetical protein